MAISVVPITVGQDYVVHQQGWTTGTAFNVDYVVNNDVTGTGSSAFQNNDILVLLHTIESSNSIVPNATTGGEHPSQFLGPMIQYNNAGSFLTDGWLDLGYAREDNVCVGAYSLVLKDSNTLQNLRIRMRYNANVANGDNRSVTIRAVVVRGAVTSDFENTSSPHGYDQSLNGSTISKSSGIAIPDPSGDMDWSAPTSGLFATSGSGIFSSTETVMKLLHGSVRTHTDLVAIVPGFGGSFTLTGHSNNSATALADPLEAGNTRPTNDLPGVWPLDTESSTYAANFNSNGSGAKHSQVFYIDTDTFANISADYPYGFRTTGRNNNYNDHNGGASLSIILREAVTSTPGTPASLTADYAISVTGSPSTLGSEYAVTSTGTEADLQSSYTVKLTGDPQTLSSSYAVKSTGTAQALDSEYTVKSTGAAQTLDSEYTIKLTGNPQTLSGSYAVQDQGQAQTLDSEYAVKDTTGTASLSGLYAVQSTGTPATLSSEYQVAVPDSEDLSSDYAVKVQGDDQSLTSSHAVKVQGSPPSLSSSYDIASAEPGTPATLGSEYSVKSTGNPQEVQADYSVTSTATFANLGGSYGVTSTGDPQTLSSGYAVTAPPNGVSLGAEYTVSVTGDQQEVSSAYAVTSSDEQALTGSYVISDPDAVSLSASYAVQSQGQDQDLTGSYGVTSASEDLPSLSSAYAVTSTGTAQTLDGSYLVSVAGQEADLLSDYAVISSGTEPELTAGYAITSIVDVDNSYAIKTSDTLEVSSSYAVTIPDTENLSASYALIESKTQEIQASYEITGFTAAAPVTELYAEYAVINQDHLGYKAFRQLSILRQRVK